MIWIITSVYLWFLIGSSFGNYLLALDDEDPINDELILFNFRIKSYSLIGRLILYLIATMLAMAAILVRFLNFIEWILFDKPGL